MTGNQSKTRLRLSGLDLARYFALVGMVIVNFDVMMVGTVEDGTGRLAELLQGRAAATFVVLAGVGFGLAAQNAVWSDMARTTLKRAAFLFVLGMINMVIFPADIIHYYAFYFLFGLLFLRSSVRQLFAAIVLLVICFPILALLFDYDSGWQWKTVTYDGLWTIDGYLRNLIFNGWHPVIPWLAFLLWGLVLSRTKLQSSRVQFGLLIGGSLVFAVTLTASDMLKSAADAIDPELHFFFSTVPIPPMPLFVVAGGSIACSIIGACLLLEPMLRSLRIVSVLSPAGRQTLTLYIAHIVIGMGVLETAGLIGGQTPQKALFASLLYCLLATVFSLAWSQFFKRGPLEALMRRATG